MTTYVEARDAIVTFITSNFTDIPVFWENTLEVDLDEVDDRFLRVEIDFNAGEQISIEFSPQDRTYGIVVLTVMTKEGLGTRATLAVQDTLKQLLRHQTLSGVVLRTPVPGDKQVKGGWEARELLVPFHFDSYG